MKVSDAVDMTVDGEVAVITIDNPPVNALSPEVRDGIYAGVEAGIKDPKVPGHPAHLRRSHLRRRRRHRLDGQGQAGRRAGPHHHRPDRRLTRPVIAAIQGAALGGGLEITLAAHWRVAEKSARCGLPEVKIGILPGAGGTQRLPRLVGAAKALDMIIFGEHITAPEALAIGVFDELLEDGQVRDGGIAFARKVVREQRPLKLARNSTHHLDAAKADPGLFDRFAAEHAEYLRGGPAPMSCFRSVRAAFEVPMDEGLDLERQITDVLIPGVESKAMRHIFFAERAIWKVPGVERDAKPVPPRKVGVMGEADALAATGLPLTADPAEFANCDLVLKPLGGPRGLIEAQRNPGTSDIVAFTVMQALKKAGWMAILTKAPGVAERMIGALRAAAQAVVARGEASRGQVDQLLYDFGFPHGVAGWDAEADDALGEAKAEAVLHTILFPVVDEAARVLDEGLAQRASDIDFLMVTAYSWPIWRGGPTHWGEDLVGLTAVAAGLDAPSAALKQLADKGESFANL